MQRLKTIDNFRGFIIVAMIFVHLLDWWMIYKVSPTTDLIWLFVAKLFGPGFLFISGVSTAIMYISRIKKVEQSELYSYTQFRNEYLFRALFILIIAVVYNSFVAIALLDPLWVWSWFMLFTIGFSLFLSWPLLRKSKRLRIYICLGLYIVNYIVLYFLRPHAGGYDFLGLLYWFLYNPIGLEPLIAFYTFFLLGTVIGELIYEVFSIKDKKERRIALRKKIIYPVGGMSVIIIILHHLVIFPFLLSQDLGLTWIAFSIGANLAAIVLLLILEEYLLSGIKKGFKFFFYFSFYSLTIYLTHNILFVFFDNTLGTLTFWLAFFITIFIIWAILKLLYNKFGPKVAIKYYMTKLSISWAKKIEEKRITEESTNKGETNLNNKE